MPLITQLKSLNTKLPIVTNIVPFLFAGFINTNSFRNINLIEIHPFYIIQNLYRHSSKKCEDNICYFHEEQIGQLLSFQEFISFYLEVTCHLN